MTATTDTTQAVRERLLAEHGEGITVGRDCDLPDDLVVEIDPGARVLIGDRVSIRRGTTLQAHRGGTIVLGHGAVLGENCFLSAMVGIVLGQGAALSNMVDLHDHNHRVREAGLLAGVQDANTPWASGFNAAPIVLEPAVAVSNKATITAGVHVGANTLIGANAVVTHSLPPDTVAHGAPARPTRAFAGPPAPDGTVHRTLRVGWFGTSIVEHLEGYNARLVNQADLPPVGSSVIVEGWHQRGYVQRLRLALQSAYPHLRFTVDNRGEGGATSRDIAGIVRDALADGARYDLAFLDCGINDVWRGFQGRTAEAVDENEYAEHYRAMLSALTAAARTVVCLTETPFGPVDTPQVVEAMNAKVARYNHIAAQAAAQAGVPMLDVWTPFARAARILADQGPALWSDGAHMSELGDALLLREVEQYLTTAGVLDALSDYPQLEREAAAAHYHDLIGTLASAALA